MGKSIAIRGGKLFYNDTGSGTALVFLHGYLESLEIWKDFVPDLAGQYRIIAVDLPGHGRSSVFGSVHTMEFMAESVHLVLQKAGVEKCILIGHSMGGYVALAFAGQYPEAVGGLCLFHSGPFPDDENKRANRDRAAELVRLGRKEQLVMAHAPMTFSGHNLGKNAAEIRRIQDLALKTPDEGIVAALMGMKVRPDRSEVLRNLSCPVLIVAGKDDNFIPPDATRKMISLLQHPEIKILESSGHMGFVEEKEASLAALRDYLEQIVA